MSRVLIFRIARPMLSSGQVVDGSRVHPSRGARPAGRFRFCALQILECENTDRSRMAVSSAALVHEPAGCFQPAFEVLETLVLALRLPVLVTGDILASMHNPIRAAVLSSLPLLLILAYPPTGARAARLDSAVRASIATVGSPHLSPDSVGYTYTVQPTDTLWDIAVSHGITVDALIAANALADPRLLRPGQTLFVPAPPPAVKSSMASTVSDRGSAAPPVEPRAAASDSATEPAPGPGAGASVPRPGPDGTGLPPEKASWPSELLSLMNDARGAAGLPPLIWSPELAGAAQAHAEDCARRNRGSHIGSDSALLITRIKRTSFAPRWASENWANTQTVQQAFSLWWNEKPGRDPHRRNILDPKYSAVGIGVAAGRWGSYFVADFAGR